MTVGSHHPEDDSGVYVDMAFFILMVLVAAATLVALVSDGGVAVLPVLWFLFIIISGVKTAYHLKHHALK